jgi:hypothetical protein
MCCSLGSILSIWCYLVREQGGQMCGAVGWVGRRTSPSGRAAPGQASRTTSATWLTSRLARAASASAGLTLRWRPLGARGEQGAAVGGPWAGGRRGAARRGARGPRRRLECHGPAPAWPDLAQRSSSSASRPGGRELRPARVPGAIVAGGPQGAETFKAVPATRRVEGLDCPGVRPWRGERPGCDGALAGGRRAGAPPPPPCCAPPAEAKPRAAARPRPRAPSPLACLKPLPLSSAVAPSARHSSAACGAPLSRQSGLAAGTHCSPPPAGAAAAAASS